MSTLSRAVFLDRDGVLNEPAGRPTGPPESPLTVTDVMLVDGAAEAVAALNAAGLRVIVVSNQPAAAKGTLSVDEVLAIHARVIALIATRGATIDASYLCLHHPDGTDPQLGGPCDCRKPSPGLLVQAATEHDVDLGRSWMIGDSDADVGAARAAGLAGIVIVTNPLSSHRRGPVAATADATVTSISAATSRILAEMS